MCIAMSFNLMISYESYSRSEKVNANRNDSTKFRIVNAIVVFVIEAPTSHRVVTNPFRALFFDWLA